MSQIPYNPPWLVAKTEQRLAFIIENGALEAARESGAMVIMIFLDEGEEHMTKQERERWERTCDCCGQYISGDGEFYTGHMNRTAEDVQIFMAFGVCGDCKRAHTQEGNEK